MKEILLLDQNTINKIAAGEVVERPLAVVKELVENAIDAGASAITVEIKGGGIEMIRITDNGSGIEKEQVRIAFERHATSKIRSAQDLLTVGSLGFRGEALASISAVAQVETITKTRGALTGIRYVIDGGEEKSLEEIGCPEGTTFVVRNLFYNVPARRKFLKSAQTEASYINDLVERLAMSHPEVSFKFMNNNQLRLQTSGNGKIKDIIYHIYGRDITANLLPVKASTSILQLNGFIAKPVVSRGNRNYMNYFINGRYMKNKVINKAIEEAYKPYTMQHRYPMTALHFSIDSEYIDVNVHPAKMEIRFTNEQTIYHEIYHAISDVLSGREMIPEVTIGKEQKKEAPALTKSAPEPFEKKRSLQESKNVGKQMVEAAKVISQYEQIRNMQTQVREEASYKKKETPAIKKEEENTQSKEAFMQAMKQLDTFEEAAAEPTVVSAVSKLAEESKEEIKTNGTDKKETATMAEQKPGQIKQEELQKLDKTVSVLPEDTNKETIWDKSNSQQTELFQTKEEQKLLSKEAKKHHKIIGQIFDTYWIIQYEDKMFIIDQHAAHEKVLFEQTMRNLEKKEFTSQIVQPPIILTLTLREQQALEQYRSVLERIGFEIEAFGGREFSVRAVPANLFGIAQIELLTELLDSLLEEKQVKDANLLLERVASMSCKAAVKGNMKLSMMEAEALIDELMELENPYNCPHGRPVIVSMTKYEIEKKFKRIL